MIEVTESPLSVDTCIQAVASPNAGGITVFLGTVRNNSDGVKTTHLEYEAYREMAERVIGDIGTEAEKLFDIIGFAVQHRTGNLEIGEVSVVVAVSAPHRDAAFKACRFVIDELKSNAPIWKKEFGEMGEVWVGSSADGAAQPPM